MPERTRSVFEALSKEPLMSGFVLIGGTALSIQIGHRLSEDLDFWLPGDRMSKPRVDAVLANLAVKGHHHDLVTPAWKISQAKINGTDLLAQSRDHVIDGVKVTFFARNDIPYQHFSKMRRIVEDGIGFEVMHKDSIFDMKAWLISQRIRSRDLFDLMVFVRDQGKTIRDILEAGVAADPGYQREYAKDVLIGTVPVDKEDEGFASIGLDVDIKSVHEFFLDRVNQYEISVATSIVRSMETATPSNRPSKPK